MLDTLLFAVFPYVAAALAVGVGLYRYFSDRFSFSSRSSQFLENRALFWGSVPWHYGILIVLLAHLVAVLVPGLWASVLGEPLRLYVLEVTGLALGTLTVVGIGLLILRRLGDKRAAVITSTADWVLLACLFVQVVFGVYIALFYRWGSFWYLSNAVPWLWSLVRLDPQLAYIATLPWPVKLHFFNAFLLVALFPFTRLVHAVTAPVTYLWRPHQVVLWQKAPGRPALGAQVGGFGSAWLAPEREGRRVIPGTGLMLFFSVMALALAAGGLFSTGAWLYQSREQRVAPTVELVGVQATAVSVPATTPSGEAKPVTPPAASAAGQSVFQQFCDSCHPGGREGVGPELRGAAFQAKYGDDAALKRVITDGRGGMPGFKQLSASQLEQLLAYIQSMD